MLCDLALLSVEREETERTEFENVINLFPEGKEGAILILKVHFFELIFVLKQKIKMFCKIYDFFI